MGGLLDKPCKEKHTESGAGMGMEYAISAMQGWRKSMEDAHIAEFSDVERSSAGTNKPPKTPVALFGVYDGHGGKDVSEYVALYFGNVFDAVVDAAGGEKAISLGDALQGAYHELDRRMYKDPAAMSRYGGQGCTAVTCAIRGKSCVFANAGDSRALIGTKSGVVRLATHDHKPNSPRERSRILEAGGTVDLMTGQYRVCQNLNLSRALGDLRYKTALERTGPDRQIIAGHADLLETELEESDDLLILACDGIWDVVSNEECLFFVQTFLKDDHTEANLRKCCEALLERCCSPDSNVNSLGTDNMTVCIVSLRDSARDSAAPKPMFKLKLGTLYSDVEVYSNSSVPCSSESSRTKRGVASSSSDEEDEQETGEITSLPLRTYSTSVFPSPIGSSAPAPPTSGDSRLMLLLRKAGATEAVPRYLVLPEAPKKVVLQDAEGAGAGREIVVY